MGTLHTWTPEKRRIIHILLGPCNPCLSTLDPHGLDGRPFEERACRPVVQVCLEAIAARGVGRRESSELVPRPRKCVKQ